ncbi:TetR/AcrR family transcriptional regulator [Lentzea sp. NPDC092896]|uniref:TetR/AcrR family transcriptional regulator n=1 Tax=Lentzea sp. NPDC092896 TaxID=3364127 RepID=UPI0038164384
MTGLTSLSGVATRTRRTNTEQKILDAAAELFHRDGVRGVGMDRVIAESGVAKSTMYAHFPTKDDLLATYLSRTDDSWMDKLRTAARAAGDEPRDQLVGLFDALEASFDRHGFFGCPFISAAVETAAGSQAQAATVAHTERRQRWLTELSAAAGASEPAELAAHIGLLIDGALATGRLLQNRSVIEGARTAARHAVDGHLGR